MESMRNSGGVSPLGRTLRRVAALSAIAIVAIHVAPQKAAASTVTVPASKDSWIDINAQSTNHGTDTQLSVKRRSQDKLRALVQFDLSGIPACASITTATLTLHVDSNSGSTNTNHSVNRLAESWTETGVTWSTRDGSTDWGTAGGSVVTQTSSADTGTTAGFVSWDVTSDVQSFVDGTNQNYGWVIKGSSEPGNTLAENTTLIRYASKDIANGPALEVTYELADAKCDDHNECTADTCTAGGCQNVALEGQPCGDPSDTECTNPDSCDAFGTCRSNDEGPGAHCGDAGTDCVVQDTCDGSGSCTDNGFADPDTACGDPSDTECTHPDTCDGAGTCQSNNEDSGTFCGDAGTECIHQDTCNGSGSCTDNGFMAPNTSCGDPTDTECANPDTCDGAGTCQSNDEVAGTYCGDAGTECIHQDTCDGSGSCTDNGFMAPATPCGSSSDTDCTNPDTCNGAGTCLANDATDGASCNDGEACTATDTCEAGTCVGADVICGVDAVCSPQPKMGCRNPTQSNKAKVVILNKTPNAGDRVGWKWIKGAQTTSDSLGDPVNGSTGYRLCVYDESDDEAAEVYGVTVPPGGTCGQKPCWKKLGARTTKGYLYKDSQRVAGGVFKMLLRAGDSGKARILFKAKGANVAPPTLPLQQDGSVIVQLNRTDDPTECWEAYYSAPAKNGDVSRGIKFIDKGD